MELFIAMHEQKGPKTADELAQAAEKDPYLVKRMLRTLSAAHVIEQDPRSEAYVTTPMSEVLLTPEPGQALDFLFEGGYPYSALIPEYMSRNGFVTPTDMGAWQNFRKTDKTVWEWFGAHPDEIEDFVGVMKA